MTTAITNARIFTARHGEDVFDGAVLIEGERIAAVGKSLPAAAETIDARRAFLMPGLVDMHVHTQLCGEDSLLAFLGTGVTTVRDLGSDPTLSLPVRDDIANDDRDGPNLFVYGPLLDGDPPIFGAQAFGTGPAINRVLASPEQGVAAVNELIKSGVDGLKLYAGLRPDMVEPMIAAAAGRVPVTGHLGRTWASEAVAMGIDGLEHVHATCYQDIARPGDRHTREGGNGTMPNYWTWLSEGWANADLDAPYVAGFIAQLVEARTIVSPTTVLITAGMATTEAADEPGQRYRPRAMTERTAQRQEMMRRAREAAEKAGNPLPAPQPVDPAVGARARANELEFLRRLHEAGGIVVPSTDVGAAPLQVPGFSLHRELALLVEAGIPARSVLESATRVAAESLRRADSLGTIEPGKLADLLLIDGDPLTAIADSRKLTHVIKSGKLHNPQSLLDRIET